MNLINMEYSVWVLKVFWMNNLIFSLFEDYHCDSDDVSVVEMLGVKVREYLSRQGDIWNFLSL